MSRAQQLAVLAGFAVLTAMIPYGARPDPRIPVAGPRPAEEWPTADGVDGTHYSPLADITADNVDALEVAWTYRTGDGATDGGRPGRHRLRGHAHHGGRPSSTCRHPSAA